MDLEPKPVKRKSRVLRVVCIGLAGILILLFGIGFLLTRTPACYKPAGPENANEVSQYLTNYVAPEIHNKSQLDEPFELVVAEEGLNDIIARGPWPLKLGGVTVTGPAVVLSQDRLLFMAAVRYVHLPMVVTVVMRPRLDEDGLLSINLQQVTAGVFDVTCFAKGVIEKIVADNVRRVDGTWADDTSAALLENKPFEPVFTVYDRQIRLTGIDILDREAVLHFVPEVNH